MAFNLVTNAQDKLEAECKAIIAEESKKIEDKKVKSWGEVSASVAPRGARGGGGGGVGGGGVSPRPLRISGVAEVSAGAGDPSVSPRQNPSPRFKL